MYVHRLVRNVSTELGNKKRCPARMEGLGSISSGVDARSSAASRGPITVRTRFEVDPVIRRSFLPRSYPTYKVPSRTPPVCHLDILDFSILYFFDTKQPTLHSPF
ncbi:hypothetical protein KC19_12G020800 [Ceratodon purpureus]|uniref:Uncharacterized protein n=1 Tax=Ceratodon purpureus TaxID=3225 RepID=A0A8T0G3R6_CERPU|nr:hypothetical protein KC19_12G020800 [Ceratodon purpureus]